MSLTQGDVECSDGTGFKVTERMVERSKRLYTKFKKK